jgi:phosphoglycerate dehydrogenase-like enzyme
VSAAQNAQLIIQTEELHELAATWLSERAKQTGGQLVRCATDDPKFSDLLLQASALVVRTYTRVDAALLARAPRLKVVGRAGVGLDRIDVAACNAAGVRVVHTPDANTQAVAEYVFALLLDATRPRLTLADAIDQRAWNALRAQLLAPNQLSELRLGILGLGRVGKRVARIASGFGMDTLFHDIAPVEAHAAHGARSVSLDELLATSDILTLHIDARESNRRFCNAEFWKQCKPTVLIINTARGLIIDDLALAAFLRDNPSAKALLDVHDPEPFPANYPLAALENAHLSPHIAAATAAAHMNMSWVVRDIWAVLMGGEVMHEARQ